MNFEDFLIDLEQEKKIFLNDINGKVTDQYLTVKSTDCEDFQIMELSSYRKMSNYQKSINVDDPATYTDQSMFILNMRLDKLTCLITGWSFDRPFSKEECKSFLKKAPYVVTQLDKLITDKAFFFNLELKD